jgi:hypothetical protein
MAGVVEALSKPACLGAVSSEEWGAITRHVCNRTEEGTDDESGEVCGDEQDSKRRGRPRDKDKAKREETARLETVALVDACPGLYTSVWSLFQMCSTMGDTDRLRVLEDWCRRWCEVRLFSKKDHESRTIANVFGNPLYTMVKEICVDNPRRVNSKTGFFSYQMKQFTFQVLEIMVLMEAISSAVAEVADGTRSTQYCARILSCKRQFVAWLHAESGPGKRHGDILYCGDDSDVNARRVIMDGLYFHHIQRTEIESKKAGVACVTRKDKTARQLNADEHMLQPHLAWCAPSPIMTRVSADGKTVLIECGGVVLRSDRPKENLPLGVDISCCRHIVGRCLGPYERGKIKKVAVGRIKTILFGPEYPECLLPPLNPSMNDSYGADGPGMLRWKRILNRRGTFAMKQAIRVSKRNRMEASGDSGPPTGTWGMFESPEIVHSVVESLPRADVELCTKIEPAALHPINKDREFYGYAQLLYKKKLALVADFCVAMCADGDINLVNRLGLTQFSSILSARGTGTRAMEHKVSAMFTNVAPPTWDGVDDARLDIAAHAILASTIDVSAVVTKAAHARIHASSHHFTALQEVYFHMLSVLESLPSSHHAKKVWEQLSMVEITLGHGLFISYGMDVSTHRGVYEYLKLPWLPNPEETEPDNLDRRGYSWVGVGKKAKKTKSNGVVKVAYREPAHSTGMLLCGVCNQLAVAPVQWASHAVACMSCVWGECVGWVGMDFECPPRQKIMPPSLDTVDGKTFIAYTPEEAFRSRTRPGVWQAGGLANAFIAPATLAQKMIHEQMASLQGEAAAVYGARRQTADEEVVSMTTVWTEAHGLTMENSTGHWVISYTDSDHTPHCRGWHPPPYGNVVLCRRSKDGGVSDEIWVPKDAHELVGSIQTGDGMVTAFIKENVGECEMYKLQNKTALDIWDSWAHNPASETEYARQLGIPPFSLSHLIVTYALIKNSGMEQMIIDEWSRTKGAMFEDTGTTFSFGQSCLGSLPSILRKSYAGSVTSNIDRLVRRLDILP